MTYIVPVTAGVISYGTMVAIGHPTAAPFVAAGFTLAGWLGRFGGHGIHLRAGQMRTVERLMHRSMAANWGIRPLAMYYEGVEQQRLLGSIFDAVAGEGIQNLVEQWPVLWAHVQRVHQSGIPPLASLKAMKRAYRPGLFGKDKGKARELAQPVVDAYAMLHPDPEKDREWYMQWARSIGLPDNVAHQLWADAMTNTPRATHVAADETEVEASQVTSPPVRSASHHHLSDDEIERRMAASR